MSSCDTKNDLSYVYFQPTYCMREYLRDQFAELAKDQSLLDEIADRATVKQPARGTVMIDYGDYMKFVPLVVKGLLKIMRENDQGKEVLLYFLSGGSTCAATFSCCLVRKRSEIKAMVEEDATIIMIPLEAADRWMSTHKVWRDFVMNMYDERLFAMIDLVDRLAFARLDEKLLDYLKDRQIMQGTRVLDVSHQSIAIDLNASREAISRLLKKLEQQGRVRIGRNQIELLE